MTPQPAKFLLTYDKEYDRDIHACIETTPPKRRSHRIRALIRAGLLWEAAREVAVKQKDRDDSSVSFSHTIEPLQITRPPVPRFNADSK